MDGCRRGKEKHNTRYRRLDLASLPLTGTASAHSSLSVSFVPVGQCRRLFAENLIIYTHTVWGAQQLTVEQDRKPFLLTIYCFLFFCCLLHFFSGGISIMDLGRMAALALLLFACCSSPTGKSQNYYFYYIIVISVIPARLYRLPAFCRWLLWWSHRCT